MTCQRPRCEGSEEILRGITSEQFEDNTPSPDLFEGDEVSVNRLKIMSREKSIIVIRHNTVNSIPACYIFTVTELVNWTQEYVSKNTDLKRRGFTVWVEEAPTEKNEELNQLANPAHAEIEPKITLGLSKHLINCLSKLSKLSLCGDG